MVPTSRRRLLATLGAGGALSVAGCLDSLPRYPRRVHNRDAEIADASAGWRSKHGGSARQSIAEHPLPTDAIAEAVLELDGWQAGGVAFAPDQVLVPTKLPPEWDSAEPSFEGLLALDPATGDEQWRFAYDQPFASPTVRGDAVFVQGKTTYALDRADGSVYWQYRSGYGFAGTAPVVVGDVVGVIAARSRSVVGLDARTGERRWHTPLARKYPTGIAAGDGAVFACTPADDDDGEAGELVRIDAASGTFDWRTELHARVSTPAVGDDRVYCWLGRSLAAFDRATGEQVWSVPIAVDEHAYPNLGVGDGQVVTVAGESGRDPVLVARDAATGERRWRGPRVHRTEFDPIAIDADRVYVPAGHTGGDADDAHRLAAVDRVDGSVVDRWDLPGPAVTGAALDDGRAVLLTRPEHAEELTLLGR